MKKSLFIISSACLLFGCTSQDVTYETEGYDPSAVEYRMDVIPPDSVQTQPDEARSVLQSLDVHQIPVKKFETAPYMEILAKKIRMELRSSSIQVKQVDGQIDLIIPNKVAFGANQTKLQPNFETSLSSVAKLLKEYDLTMVQLIGYTDDSGSVLANKELSLKKADAIADYLRSQGVEPGRIITDGVGGENPIANNVTKEGREQNRRVEMTLISLQ